MVLGGAAQLTSGNQDPVGKGYLRLTTEDNGQLGYCFNDIDYFPTDYGLEVSFEYYSWGLDGSAADGIVFFLMDASVTQATFKPGAAGGGLGYAQNCKTPGISKGYMAIGLDEYGNFTGSEQGCRTTGSPDREPHTIAIRGPGSSKAGSDYPLLKFGKFDRLVNETRNDTTASGPGYRRVYLKLEPREAGGFLVTVEVQVAKKVFTVINKAVFESKPFPRLKFGLAASTGAASNYHEVRNLRVDVHTPAAPPPVARDTSGGNVCTAKEAIVDIHDLFQSNLSGGALNPRSIDLDPSTEAIETSMVNDAGRWVVNTATGELTFTPDEHYNGVAAIQYRAKDSYGVHWSNIATVTYNVVWAKSVAGVDIFQCENPDFTMAANPPRYGNAEWHLLSWGASATIADAAAPTTTVTGVAAGSSVRMRWTVTNGVCADSSEVTLYNDHAARAIAGEDQRQCNNSTFSMRAEAPAAGRGRWKLVSGKATIVDAAAPTTTVTGVAAGSSVRLRWIVTGRVCADSSEVRLYNDQPVESEAGEDQRQCNNSTFSMQAEAPVVGRGRWELVSGKATIVDPAAPTTTVTGVAAGSSVRLRWMVTNGGCAATSEVGLYNDQLVVSKAGEDQRQCNNGTFSMQAEIPVAGRGRWELVSGKATIVDPAAPTTIVKDVAEGNSVRLRWTVRNGACAASSEVVLSNNSAISALRVATADASCLENKDGEIRVSPVGGTPAYMYSIDSWTSAQAIPDFRGLGAGAYRVAARDMNGCEKDTTVIIHAPPGLNITASSVPVRCFGDKTGEIHAVASGGTPPYAYSINNWSGAQESPDFKGLGSGAYILAVRDRNGCQQQRAVNVEQPPELQGKLETVRNACAPGMTGAIHVSAAGGVGTYEYSIAGNGMTNNNGMFNQLPEGTYHITIADGNHCTVGLGPIVVHASPPLELYLERKEDIRCKDVDKGMAIMGVKGGSPPYQFRINGGAPQASGVFKELDEGEYTVAVTDANSCSFALSFNIAAISNECELFMPNAFSPNGDGRNDVFRPVNYGKITNYSLKIFNRWGTLLFQSSDPRTGWDGMYKGQPQPVAAYTWILEYMDKRSVWIRRSGACILAR